MSPSSRTTVASTELVERIRSCLEEPRFDQLIATEGTTNLATAMLCVHALAGQRRYALAGAARGRPPSNLACGTRLSGGRRDPSTRRCSFCGYGVAAGRIPDPCPMCGRRDWREVRRAAA